MTQQELTLLQLGENLDQLANLDPRGYGVCRVLYAGARKRNGRPLSTHAAKVLVEHVKSGDLVYILSGFVLRPHGTAETDGMVSAILLARALVVALDAKPVLLCPTEALEAAQAMARVVGLHHYDNIDDLRRYPAAMAAIVFTKDAAEAPKQAAALLDAALPVALIADECAGANALGVYHNAVGIDMTELEAKTAVRFAATKKRGVLTIGVGDLGNETGMGSLKEHLEQYMPYCGPGRCFCECGGGIVAATSADIVLTGTTSDWAVYALIAALAYLTKQSDAMHTGEMEKATLEAGYRAGLVDMYGWHLPAIDGFSLDLHLPLVDLMGALIRYPPTLTAKCKTWFDKVLERGFFAKG